MELGYWVGGLGEFFGMGFGVEGEVGVPLFGDGEALDGFGDAAFTIAYSKARSGLVDTSLAVRSG
jgi:hypothetical protein